MDSDVDGIKELSEKSSKISGPRMKFQNEESQSILKNLKASKFDADFWIRTINLLGYPVKTEDLDIAIERAGLKKNDVSDA